MDMLSGIKFADHWVAVASALIAAAAAVISLLSAMESRRKGRRDIIELQIKYFDGIRKWAEVSASHLTEAIYLCDLEPSLVQGEKFFDRRHRLRVALSHQIDLGRWYFPNIEIDSYGSNKTEGYRGYRHEVIDGLNAAHISLSRMDYSNKHKNTQIRNELVAAKRHFIGQVQRILDPARQQKEFDAIVRSGRKRARSSEP